MTPPGTPEPGTRWRSRRSGIVFVVDGFRTLQNGDRTECAICYNEADPRGRVLLPLSDWGASPPVLDRVR